MAPPVDPPLQERIVALYSQPPTLFVAARDALARDLRAAGDVDGAAAVRALRRPTVDAWCVNQLARTHREGLEALVASGAALADAQAQGDATAVRDATRRRRALLDGLADAAVAAASAIDASGANRRDGVASLLDAASLDPEAQVALTEGRLTREVARVSGFGTDDGDPDARVDAPPPARRARLESAPRHDELALKRAQAALAGAADVARDAGRVLEAARAAEQDAQSALVAAVDRVDELTAALDAARQAARDAKQRAVGASRDAVAARSAERRAAARRDRAEQAVADAATREIP